MKPASAKELIYRIDAASIIISVNEQWDRFLRENSPPSAPILDYLGTRLWNHLGDATTILLYQALVARARKTGKELVLPFRCDAPDKRRFLQMHIHRVEANAIEFSSVTLREETRVWVPLLDQRARHSEELLRMCSWCKQVALPDWVEVEEAVDRLKLFATDLLPQITHGICPSCAERVRQEIESAD